PPRRIRHRSQTLRRPIYTGFRTPPTTSPSSSPGVSTSASSPPTVSPTAAAARPCWPASSTPYDAVYPRDWRNWPNSAAPCTGGATMCWPTSTTTPPTDPPKPSTGGWKPYAETPSDSATSPTPDCACRRHPGPDRDPALDDDD